MQRISMVLQCNTHIKSFSVTSHYLNWKRYGISQLVQGMLFRYINPNWYQLIQHIDGILPKGPYPPCLRMADRALLAGYPRYVKKWVMRKAYPCYHVIMTYVWTVSEVENLPLQSNKISFEASYSNSRTARFISSQFQKLKKRFGNVAQ